MNRRTALPNDEALEVLLDVIQTVYSQLRNVARDLNERQCALAELRVDALRRLLRYHAFSPLGIGEAEAGKDK